MAFCKQCGTDLNDAAFCPNCGTPAAGDLAAQNRGAAPVYADVRQRSMADMENLMTYFGAKQAQYDEFDAVCAQIEDLSSRSIGGWIIAAVICGIIGFFAPFFFVLTAAFIAAAVLFKKKNKEKLAAATARQEALGKELADYYADYGYCSVGFEYTKPSTLAALYDLIRKGRVTTPADAINIYLDDLHKQKMEQEAVATRIAAEETAVQARNAAKSAKKAASYSSASFWFK